MQSEEGLAVRFLQALPRRHRGTKPRRRFQRYREEQQMRTVESWFSFEGRCLLCSQKTGVYNGPNAMHLKSHVREGYLNEDFDQIKPHPVGFPGPPLGQQPSCSMVTEERRFPIIRTFHSEGAPQPEWVPWKILKAHEDQAIKNHDQTLEQLAARGGLDPCEVVAILDGMSFRDRWPTLDGRKAMAMAIERLHEICSNPTSRG